MEMDTWSQMFAEKFNDLFKVCVHTGRGQSNVGWCGQAGGVSKITENVWTSFKDDPLYRNHYCFQKSVSKSTRKITSSRREEVTKDYC